MSAEFFRQSTENRTRFYQREYVRNLNEKKNCELSTCLLSVHFSSCYLDSMSITRQSPLCHGCHKYLVQDTNSSVKNNEVKQLKKCIGCRVSKYCSPVCQKFDWKFHRLCCRFIKTSRQEMKHLLDKDLTGKHTSQDMENKELVELVYKKVSVSLAIWSIAQSYRCYGVYMLFLDTALEVMNMSRWIFSRTTLRFYMGMALITLGRFSEAYSLIRYWMIAGYPPFCKSFLEGNRYPCADMRENLLELIYHKKRNHEETYRFSFADLHRIRDPFIPMLIALKIQILLDLGRKYSDYSNFMEAIKGDNGGMLCLLNKNVPDIIDKISALLLGCKRSAAKLKHWKFHIGPTGYRDRAIPFLTDIDNQRDDLMMYVAAGRLYYFPDCPLQDFEFLYKSNVCDHPFNKDHIQRLFAVEFSFLDPSLMQLGKSLETDSQRCQLATYFCARTYFRNLFQDHPETQTWMLNTWWNNCLPDYALVGGLTSQWYLVNAGLPIRSPGFAKFRRALWRVSWWDQSTWESDEDDAYRPPHNLITPISQCPQMDLDY